MASWVESLQSVGRYTFTRTEAETTTGRTFIAVQSALRRLKEQNRIFSPRRGFYVVVPAEYRNTGVIPASWFIDDLMKFIGQPYYVGLLSAAAIHGAAHQQPMVFQVITNKPTRLIQYSHHRIHFTMSSLLEQMPVQNIQTETGSILVGTPETTAFDLIRYHCTAGHVNHVASVLSELIERIDKERILDVAGIVRIPDVQRLGYILDIIGEKHLADELAEWIQRTSFQWVKLSSDDKVKPSFKNRWKVSNSEKVELDE